MRRLLGLSLLVACASPRFAEPPRTAPSAVVERLTALRAEAHDSPSGPALYSLAFYEAQTGHVDAAIETLRRLDAVAWDGGLMETDFVAIASVPAFREISARLAARLPSAHRSVAGFTVAEAGLHAEGIAYDPDRAAFYVGSTTSGRIIAVDATGRPREVTRTGFHEVLGLKVGTADHALWAACNDDTSDVGPACLLAVEPVAGVVLRRACLAGRGHELNDLALAADGTAYVTDSASGAVLRLRPAQSELEEIVAAGRFRGTNGIALGGGDRVLLVAHSRGIARIDLETDAVQETIHAPTASFAGIDGMALRGRTLFAIASTYGMPRVVRIVLDRNLVHVEEVEVVETGTPEWDEPTTGALGPDGFYYVADSQLSSKSPARSTVVLKIAY